MRLLSLIPIALLALGLGCDSPTAPGAPDTFVTAALRENPAGLTPFAVDVADRRVIIHGHIITSDPCHGFAVTRTRRDRRLVLTLHARPTGLGCLAPAGEWNYRISAFDVPEGEWRVTVRHSFASGTVAETPIEATVVVPPGL